MEAVLKILKSNSEHARSVIMDVIPRIAAKDWTDIIKAKGVG